MSKDLRGADCQNWHTLIWAGKELTLVLKGLLTPKTMPGYVTENKRINVVYTEYRSKRIMRRSRRSKSVCTVAVSARRNLVLSPGADWAEWLPGTCQVCLLVRRPGGPPRQILKVVKRLPR